MLSGMVKTSVPDPPLRSYNPLAGGMEHWGGLFNAFCPARRFLLDRRVRLHSGARRLNQNRHPDGTLIPRRNHENSRP